MAFRPANYSTDPVEGQVEPSVVSPLGCELRRSLVVIGLFLEYNPAVAVLPQKKCDPLAEIGRKEKGIRYQFSPVTFETWRP
jgi:hypothetical protein